MLWQDLVITIVNIIFSISLIPQVYKGFKEKKGHISLWTSTPTFIGLYIVSFAFYTLSLYFSTVVSTCTGTLWLLLFIQKIIYKT